MYFLFVFVFVKLWIMVCLFVSFSFSPICSKHSRSYFKFSRCIRCPEEFGSYSLWVMAKPRLVRTRCCRSRSNVPVLVGQSQTTFGPYSLLSVKVKRTRSGRSKRFWGMQINSCRDNNGDDVLISVLVLHIGAHSQFHLFVPSSSSLFLSFFFISFLFFSSCFFLSFFFIYFFFFFFFLFLFYFLNNSVVCVA